MYTLTDRSGLSMDSAGVNGPGAISLTYVAAYIAKEAQSTVSVLGAITRPDFEVSGVATPPTYFQLKDRL
jgi:hypothetical protein